MTPERRSAEDIVGAVRCVYRDAGWNSLHPAAITMLTELIEEALTCRWDEALAAAAQAVCLGCARGAHAGVTASGLSEYTCLAAPIHALRAGSGKG